MDAKMVLLLMVSIGVQLIAAVLALRLIPVTRRRRAWVLISAALGLMAIRRGLTLLQAFSGKPCYPEDWMTEWVSLATSTSHVGWNRMDCPVVPRHERLDGSTPGE